MRPFAAVQPVLGDVILYCVHAGTDGDYIPNAQWFRTTTDFTSPDGVKGVAQWIVCCNSCYRGLAGDLELLTTIKIGGHFVWKNSDPIIIEELS